MLRRGSWRWIAAVGVASALLACGSDTESSGFGGDGGDGGAGGAGGAGGRRDDPGGEGGDGAESGEQGTGALGGVGSAGDAGGASGCSDADECATNHGGCDSLPRCTDLPGSDECARGSDDCHEHAACTNTPGSFTCTCNRGHYGDGVSCAAARSCAELATLLPNATTGVHWLDAGGGGFPAYCDLSSPGGPWTLALKVDGRQRTFQYDAPLWTNRELLNPSAPEFDHVEAKLDTFNRVAFSEILLLLEHPLPGARRALRLAYAATSLHDVFSRDRYVAIAPLGRGAWKTLMGESASLQMHCNREGFNVISDEEPSLYSRVRLGILGNQESDCLSADSFIGVGGLLSPCTAGVAPVAGGTAGCHPDNGDGHFPGFAWVFVR